MIREITIKTIEQIEGIIEGSTTVVVRSIWDDEQGHLLSGVLYEARYRLEDVTKRTTLRSTVLEHLIEVFKENNVQMAAIPVKQVN